MLGKISIHELELLLTTKAHCGFPIQMKEGASEKHSYTVLLKLTIIIERAEAAHMIKHKNLKGFLHFR